MKPLYALMFLVFSVAVVCAVRDSVPVRADGSKAVLIGPGVMEALAQAPTARVIVSLRAEAGAPQRERIADDIGAKQTAVTAAGARVAGTVPPAEFAIEHRYRAVAALTGTTTVAGVQALAAQPDVISIALDREIHAELAQALPIIRADDAHTLLGATVPASWRRSWTPGSTPTTRCSLTHYVPGMLPHRARRVPCRAERGGGRRRTRNARERDYHVERTSVGVAPDAAIEAFKVLDNTGSGTFADVLLAYDEIIVSHPEVDLINMSLGDGGSYAAGSCEALIPAFNGNGHDARDGYHIVRGSRQQRPQSRSRVSRVPQRRRVRGRCV